MAIPVNPCLLPQQLISISERINSLKFWHNQNINKNTDGKSVDFNYILQDKDRVSVYPVFELLNITKVTHLKITGLSINFFRSFPCDSEKSIKVMLIECCGSIFRRLKVTVNRKGFSRLPL